MPINEKNYPMTYKEYEQRVIELFIESYPMEHQERIMDRIDKLLEEDPYFIKFLYHQDCSYYDSDASNSGGIFNDDALKSRPVYNLELLIGGGL
ncbi:hypothetical protein [Methanobrevibacter sp.]|uniref:hypothetical protein n=1 Tax=Methanobrevibacter sp. TaxID=66852 RepID=UPI00386CD52E